ncbi:MAG: hypothetical protein ACRCX2_22335 [Paraclostridium sp.]
MEFSINMCRGNILQVVELAEKNNLHIESIEQGPINEDMMSVKVKLSMDNKVKDIEKFVQDIVCKHDLNSCEIN